MERGRSRVVHLDGMGQTPKVPQKFLDSNTLQGPRAQWGRVAPGPAGAVEAANEKQSHLRGLIDSASHSQGFGPARKTHEPRKKMHRAGEPPRAGCI